MYQHVKNGSLSHILWGWFTHRGALAGEIPHAGTTDDCIRHLCVGSWLYKPVFQLLLIFKQYTNTTIRFASFTSSMSTVAREPIVHTCYDCENFSLTGHDVRSALTSTRRQNLCPINTLSTWTHHKHHSHWDCDRPTCAYNWQTQRYRYNYLNYVCRQRY